MCCLVGAKISAVRRPRICVYSVMHQGVLCWVVVVGCSGVCWVFWFGCCGQPSPNLCTYVRGGGGCCSNAACIVCVQRRVVWLLCEWLAGQVIEGPPPDLRQSGSPPSRPRTFPSPFPTLLPTPTVWFYSWLCVCLIGFTEPYECTFPIGLVCGVCKIAVMDFPIVMVV